MPEPKSPFKRVRKHFDFPTLKRVCEMHETDFPEAYGMTVTEVNQLAPSNWYAHLDRGSDILAVAHLDTVVAHERRRTSMVGTAAGPVVHSGALDDRLGAYTILELLPKLDVNVDVLLTVGEEQGQSTASFFDTDNAYNWIIEFDRGGTDVVLYDYDEEYLREMVREAGARVGMGSFSDISYMEHVGVKGLNWGVGYEDYHGPRGFAYLEDYWSMISYFLNFHEVWADTHLPHEERWPTRGRGLTTWTGWDNGVDNANWDAYWENREKRERVADLLGVRLNDITDEDVAEFLEFNEDTVEDTVEDDELEDLVSDDFNVVNERLLALEAGPSAETSARENADVL